MGLNIFKDFVEGKLPGGQEIGKISDDKLKKINESKLNINHIDYSSSKNYGAKKYMYENGSSTATKSSSLSLNNWIMYGNGASTSTTGNAKNYLKHNETEEVDLKDFIAKEDVTEPVLSEEQIRKNEFAEIATRVKGIHISGEDVSSVEEYEDYSAIKLKNGTTIFVQGEQVIQMYVASKDTWFIYDNGNVVSCSDPNFSNIFNDSYASIGQYGGNQVDFVNNIDSLVNDPLVLSKIQEHFGENISYQEAYNYLASISACGCHFTSVVNGVFKQYQGREQEFLDTFGYPMYSVSVNGSVNFNYEPMIAEIHSYYWSHNFDYNGDGEYDQFGRGYIGDASYLASMDGTDDNGAEVCFNYLKEKYNLAGERDTSFSITPSNWGQYNAEGKTVILAACSYNLYNMDGSIYGYNGDTGHGMTIVGTTTDPNGYDAYIVSSWGNQYICTICSGYDSYFEYYDIIG